MASSVSLPSRGRNPVLCGSSLWKSLKPWVSQRFAGVFEKQRCDSNPDAKQSAWKRSIPRCSAIGRQKLLAYTGSSAVRRRRRAPRGFYCSTGPSTRSCKQNPPPFSQIRSVARRGRKQAWPSTQPAATPTHLHNRARLQLQRCAASARAPSRPAPHTAPPRGQPRKEHRARRRRIHLRLT